MNRWISPLVVAATLAGCSGNGSGGSNNRPVATDDAATTTEATAVVVDVLANDLDPEGDDFTIAGFTDGANGATSLTAGGALTYVPEAGFTGIDTFTYQVSDRGEETSSATVTITVDAIADFVEAAEPNDDAQPGDGVAGSFALPALGADAVVLRGCIDPYRDVGVDGEEDIDYDAWAITVTEASVVDLAVDGTGGLSAGFFLLAKDAFLAAEGWVRFGLDLEGDSATRKVYLPTAGTYTLLVGDARSITLGAAAGSPTACYLALVGRAAAPAPVTGVIGTPLTVTVDDAPVFVDVVPSANGQTLAVMHTIDGDPSVVQSSVLALRNGMASAYGVTTFTVGPLDTTDTLRLVVEPTFNLTLSPREVTLGVTIVP